MGETHDGEFDKKSADFLETEALAEGPAGREASRRSVNLIPSATDFR